MKKKQGLNLLPPMTPRQRAEHYAKEFPQYPASHLKYDERWLSGVWALGNNYRGSGFYGAFPPGLMARLQAVFPNEFRGRVLHLFSGSLNKSVGGVRLDLYLGRDPPPDTFGDAQRLPFLDASFDLILADPPYSAEDAKHYQTPMVNRAAVFREAARVLKPGGQLVWLDQINPMHRKSEWLWWGLIGVVRSTNHRYRFLTTYQRRDSIMKKSLEQRIKEATPALGQALLILMGEDVMATAVAKGKATVAAAADDDDEDDEAEAAPAPKKGRGRPAGSKNKPKDDDDEDDAPVAKKGPKPPVADDDDEDEDTDGGVIPKDATLAELDRAGLKKLATAHGLDAAGKNREDLTALLQAKRDGGKKGGKAALVADDDEDEAPAPKKKSPKPPVDDDDDEDEKPAKKKAASVADDDDEDDAEDVKYPAKIKEMKADLNAFFKLNKDPLTAGGFFGGKVKKGVQPITPGIEELMADADLIKEAWADNVWPEVQGGTWKNMKAEAYAIEDDDEDGICI